MALNLSNPETERLALRIAAITGESPDDAVRHVLAQWVAQRHEHDDINASSFAGDRETDQPGMAEKLDALAIECAALPDVDSRSPDEIIGYDKTGMW